MTCPKCGMEIVTGHKFCTNCGTSIEDSNDIVIQQNNSSNNQYKNTFNNQSANYNNGTNQQQKETLGIASLIIGIISILASLPLNIIILPISIVGLILGIINRAKGKMISGIITNTIAIIIIVGLLCLVFMMGNKLQDLIKEEYNTLVDDYKNQENTNPLIGNYKCTGVNEENKAENYKIALNLNNDYSFLYTPYKDSDKNYVIGTYTYEDENKTNASNDYKYYMLKLDASEENFIVNGKEAGRKFSANLEFGLKQQLGTKEGVIMFVESGNIYYCYEN